MLEYPNPNSIPELNYREYGDGDIPEIDLTHSKADASNVIPDEIPSRNSSGQDSQTEKEAVSS